MVRWKRVCLSLNCMKVVRDKILIFLFISGGFISLSSQTFHFKIEPILFTSFSTLNIKQAAFFQYKKPFTDYLRINDYNEKKNYIKKLPLFCKMEELIFKQSGINLRINLGTNDQVRKLEGKY